MNNCDILAQLNRLVITTPDTAHTVLSVSRPTLDAAAAEIRSLREQCAIQARQLAAASRMADNLAFQLANSNGYAPAVSTEFEG